MKNNCTMRYVILCDGEYNCGGYSTIAMKLYNFLNVSNLYNIKNELYNFTFQKKDTLNENEINLYGIANNNQKIIDKIRGTIDINNIYTIICTSPWSFYISSLYFKEQQIIYIKGGGLKGTNDIKKLENTYILNENVDNYIDELSSKLENDAIINNNNYYIIPTINIMYDILKKTQKIKFDKNRILKPYNFLWFDNIEMNETAKPYELIFVVSNHNRIIKNSMFAFKIFEKFANVKKVVIGLNCGHFKQIPNTDIINNNIPNNELMKYFQKSKIKLIPSYFDTGPSTIIESLINGCIPICYYNCGLAQLNLDGCYTMDNLLIDVWTDQINNILNDFNNLDLLKYSNDLNKLIHHDKDKFIKFLNEQI